MKNRFGFSKSSVTAKASGFGIGAVDITTVEFLLSAIVFIIMGMPQEWSVDQTVSSVSMTTAFGAFNLFPLDCLAATRALPSRSDYFLQPAKSTQVKLIRAGQTGPPGSRTDFTSAIASKGSEVDLRATVMRGGADGGRNAEDTADHLFRQDSLGRTRRDNSAIL